MRALTVALRKAISEAELAEKLGKWHSEPSIHTRRPIPQDATYPAAAISANVSRGDQDGLTSLRPVIARDITIYGENRPSTGIGDEDQVRLVEEIADDVHALFHRKKFSIVVDGHHVIDIVAAGPIPAPTDDVNKIGRVIMLTIRLQKE